MKKTTTTAKPHEPKAAKRDKYGMSAADRAHLQTMTDEDVLAAARADPDALPLEDRRNVGAAGRVSIVKRIRWRLRLSQQEFAEAFRIPIGTLRDWEQHRREPDQAARAYLDVIAREHVAVRRALEHAAAE